MLIQQTETSLCCVFLVFYRLRFRGQPPKPRRIAGECIVARVFIIELRAEGTNCGAIVAGIICNEEWELSRGNIARIRKFFPSFSRWGSSERHSQFKTEEGVFSKEKKPSRRVEMASQVRFERRYSAILASWKTHIPLASGSAPNQASGSPLRHCIKYLHHRF